MAGKNIDTSKWITQQSLANELGVTVQCIHNWIKRKRIESMKIPGSRLVLVNKESAPVPKTQK
jgi:DNA-binding XRE family transcriptional regulator